MRSLVLLIVFTLCTLSIRAEVAQKPVSTEPQSIFGLVNYQEIQEVTLEFDLDSLLRDRRNKKSFKGEFTFRDKSGNLQVWKTKVKMRGRYRRVRCVEMPPLKLSFKKDDLLQAGLAHFDDFKLVTECIEDDRKAKALLMKEYLAYKIYNELTDYSFRVQFLKINYKDKNSGRIEKQWGFIIEDTAEMRARLGAEKSEQKFGIAKETVDEKQFKTTALFQYMIGNLDWDICKRVHNVKMIDVDNVLYPVPYDFDFSGLVSANYATLNPDFNVKSIKDRLYLGLPEHLEDMQNTVELFFTEKEDIFRVVKSCKKLSREDRRELVKYLNDFYKNIHQIQLPARMESSM